MKRLHLAPTLSLFALACGGTSGNASDEEAVLTAQSVSQALTASDDLRDAVEPGDPASDRDTRAAVEAARQRLLGRTPCVQVSLLGTTLSLDFGAGCALRGQTYSGLVQVQAATTSQSLGFELGLSAFSNGSTTYDGTLTFDAGSGQTDTTLDLVVTETGQTQQFDYVGQSVGDATGRSYSGSGSVDNNGQVSGFEAQALHHTAGDCYPDAGVIIVSAPNTPDVTITFDASTPTTGLVTVQIGRLPPQSQPLPARAQCP